MQSIIPVFIASPGDVQRERRAVEEAVRTLSDKLASLFGVALIPIRWEAFAPISSGASLHPQHEILSRIEPSSIFTGILYRRYGTDIDGMNVSGTEAEFEHALNNRHQIKILTYFRDQQRDEINNLTDDAVRQLNDLIKLKDRLAHQNVFHQNYKTIQEFQRRILPDLLEVVMPMILNPEDKNINHYREFFPSDSFRFKETSPLAIVYPPITNIRVPNTNWSHFLMPTMVTEDSNAISHIERLMRLLGRQYRVLTTHVPAFEQLPPGDRVWICAPRHRQASDVLERLGKKIRFRYKGRVNLAQGKERSLLWRRRDGSEVELRSPLTKYLALAQRPPGEVLWDPRYGYTYARDYGILARFRFNPGLPARSDEAFYHYFISGMRALGTWGSSWYVDYGIEEIVKKMRQLRDDEESGDDAQFLLEVSYKDYRIVEVRDVSDEDSKFFEERISDDYIKNEFERATIPF